MSVICPRCGAPGTLVIRERGNRRYYYVVHREGRKRVEHYAGPVGDYDYVTRLHEDTRLSFRGPLDPGRVIEYMDVLIGRLADLAMDLDPGYEYDEGDREWSRSRRDLVRKLGIKLPRWIRTLNEIREKLDARVGGASSQGQVEAGAEEE